MAAGLGYKEFTTGDVLTAADANGYLASQVVMVFASAAARTSAITSPQEGMISYLKDTNSTEYYSGSAWVAIGGSAPTSPIKQIVYANANSAVTSSNAATLVDTGLTATITPTSASSTILVMVNHAALDRTQAASQMILALFRNSTSIYSMTTMFINVNIGTGMEGTMHLVRMDSPATTSPVTYKTMFRPSSGSNCTVQSSNFPSSITLMEIGA